MENYDKAYLVVSGVISWTIAFLLTRKIFPKRSFDFCNRIVSTIHALFAVFLSSKSVQDWSCPVYPLASNSSPLQMRALGVTLAYLIYDLVCCLFDKKIKIDNSVRGGTIMLGAIAHATAQPRIRSVFSRFYTKDTPEKYEDTPNQKIGYLIFLKSHFFISPNILQPENMYNN
ncbi:putative TLC domain-containing protein [Helianthus anomalus]